MYMVNPQDPVNQARAAGVEANELAVPEAVVLTFNRPIIKELTDICHLRDWDWKIRGHSPYGSPIECRRGAFELMDIAVFVPPMGASPVAAFCEELIACGARIIFLVCASWSLGEKYLRKGQIHLPSFAAGMDGTSYHYGNTGFRVDAEPQMLEILTGVLKSEGADWKQGGVGCCEAFYRITREMLDNFRQQGCLSMENGEVAALYSLAKLRGIHAGVLLQPYIDLEHGLSPDYTGQMYENTCRAQARAALKAINQIRSTHR